MKNIAYIILMAIIMGLASCKSQDSIYEEFLVPNGLIYPQQATNVVAKSGNERIEISWDRGVDPKVVKAMIFWNNYTNSAEIGITSDMGVIIKEIKPIEENTYSFMIYTYDANGNISIPTEIIGRVYGKRYLSSLNNRILINTVFDGLDLMLNWYAANHTETGVDLFYTDADGNPQTYRVDPSETKTILLDFDPDKPLFYSTEYLPDSMAIDIFHAPTIEIKIDPVEIIPKNTWVEYTLPNDASLFFALQNIWNGNLTSESSCCFSYSQPLPQMNTWDLGVEVAMNRMKLWPRAGADDIWVRGHPKIFELYGSTAPNPDGSLDDSWKPLGRFECMKPSPGTDITQGDIDFARAGIDFEFVNSDFAADPFVRVRYIRFRTISTFGSETESNVGIQEISFWGRLFKERE